MNQNVETREKKRQTDSQRRQIRNPCDEWRQRSSREEIERRSEQEQEINVEVADDDKIYDEKWRRRRNWMTVDGWIVLN